MSFFRIPSPHSGEERAKKDRTFFNIFVLIIFGYDMGRINGQKGAIDSPSRIPLCEFSWGFVLICSPQLSVRISFER
jgi:hypothetical protein